MPKVPNPNLSTLAHNPAAERPPRILAADDHLKFQIGRLRWWSVAAGAHSLALGASGTIRPRSV
jgi:hypothetical protein